MISLLKKALAWLHATPMFSPVGFIVRAVIIALVYFILQLIGLRDYTTILSGTSPSGDPADFQAILIGVLYAGAYFAFALLTPILLIAAGIFHALECWLFRTQPKDAAPDHPAN